MGKLIYTFNVSLDGFVETPDKSLDWSMVDDELHSWFNEHSRGLAAELYGRRLWEVMSAHWPTAAQDPAITETEREFAEIWNAVPKIVFSTTLDRIEHNARLVRGDVASILDEVRGELDGDLGVGGPNLAGQFIRRGLVDEYRLVIHPVVLGAGTPFWPQLDAPLALRQVGTERFASGVEVRSYVPA